MGPREEEPDKMAVQEEEDDPYAILNVSQESMTEESLQKAYKHLSRAFHPDKQPQASDCEAAQQVFVEFKNACTYMHWFPKHSFISNAIMCFYL
jgi:hypothetical protein